LVILSAGLVDRVGRCESGHRTERGVKRRPILDLSQAPLLAHEPKDEISARERALRRGARRIRAWRSDERREQRGFVRLQLGRRLAEVAARRGLYTVVPVAEVDGVQIRLQNLRLRITLLQPDRDRGLADFAGERARRRELLDPRELLRDRAAPL